MADARTKRRKILGVAKPHAAIIAALGGPKALAEAINAEFGVAISPTAVAMWNQRGGGIAHRFRPAVKKIAAAKGKSDLIPASFTIG